MDFWKIKAILGSNRGHSAPTLCPRCLQSGEVDRVLNAFGGAPSLIRALASIGHPVARSTVYRWTYAVSNNGTAGRIPKTIWPHVLRAAKAKGITL